MFTGNHVGRGRRPGRVERPGGCGGLARWLSGTGGGVCSRDPALSFFNSPGDASRRGGFTGEARTASARDRRKRPCLPRMVRFNRSAVTRLLRACMQEESVRDDFFTQYAARPATVYLVGAGPGRPELLTLRAAALLTTAEVVLYDDLAAELVAPPVLTALQRQPQQQQRSPLIENVGKAGTTQTEINRLLLHHAGEQRRSVVRLKSGDPLVYGRLNEEVRFLREHRVAHEVVPGVSSLTAAPAAAGIFLTEKEFSRSFTVLSGHDPEALPYEALGAAQHTLVLFMATRTLGVIARNLLRLGGLSRNTPVAICDTRIGLLWCGSLENAAYDNLLFNHLAPAIIVIGDIAAQAKYQVPD
ncbi:hypothetical protein CDCA_CDCA11G3243 [Cyanidium caldarium]|uniref:uroporphyrinogen-III C-methyltransferase n=1 Tax=Cyanidium caldarium TaxID=2771 RepID=A0AAV9IYM9_CYACA|nr:hypothetical protein CDCA_CDCA11G3243 [Cyanidium caldarium]